MDAKALVGASWKTTVIGYAVIVLTVANQAVREQGLPQDVPGWIGLLGGIVTGVGIALAKDFNRSNSPHPEPVAKPVNQ